MSNPTTPFGWQMPTNTDLVTDLPADFEVFGQAVATSMQDLLGGTTGQILAKTSATDMDFTWTTPNPGDITGVTAGVGISGGGTSGDVTVTNSMATAFTTSGDLIQATGSGTFARLGTGTNGQYLTTNGTTNSWATPAGGAGNMAQIATGTLSGASVVISGLSSYTDIVVFVYNNTNNTNNGTFYMRLNATATDHTDRGVYGYNSWTPFGVVNDSDFSISALDTVRTSNNNMAVIKLTNCKNPGFTDIDWSSAWIEGGDTFVKMQNAKGVYTKSEAVSSITLRNGGGSWSAGTYYVWGA